MSDLVYEPVPHARAVELLKDKPIMLRQAFDRLLPELRARAFTIGLIEDANVLQTVRDAIAELPAGAPWAEVKERVQAALADTPWLNEVSAAQRAELLMRLHGFQAYAAAQWEALQSPEARAAFPYLQYVAVGDEATRDTHRALDGLILPVDHEFWEDHYPPWEYNCRCMVVPISQEEYDEVVAAGRVAGQPAVLKEENRSQGWTIPPRSAIEYQLKHDIVDWGGGHTVPVPSPAKRGKEGAYRFHPSDLRIPLDDLRKRYAPEVFARFRESAQAERIEFADGRQMSVWEWLGGEPADGPWPRETGAPLSARAMASKIRQVARSIENEPNEVFVLLNRDGTERFPRHRTNDPRGGDVPKEWLGKMAGCTFVHNHPSGLVSFGFGTSFSPADVASSSAQRMARVVAVSPRRIYTMEPGPGGWPTPEAIRQAFEKHNDIANAYLGHRVSAGLTPEWKAKQAHNHIVWRGVAREMGMRYTVERKR